MFVDRADFIEDAYILEVSSPGLGRALKKDKHLSKSLGEAVEMKTFKPINGSKEFEGTLKAFDEKTVTLMTGEEGDGKKLVFDRSDIALIRLAFDF